MCMLPLPDKTGYHASAVYVQKLTFSTGINSDGDAVGSLEGEVVRRYEKSQRWWGGVEEWPGERVGERVNL